MCRGCRCRSGAGRITALVVSAAERSPGTRLMGEFEAFFRQAGCDIVRVEVFAPNGPAMKFYDRLGYAVRTHDLIKVLSDGNNRKDGSSCSP